MKGNLKLGIIGMSEGNGHPYSWSAIFNGFDKTYMKDCPFPVISQYLSTQTFPQDAIEDATVTHIWTQDKSISNHIAKASKIPNISNSLQEMSKQVDAVLLARDDAENHFEMAEPFLDAGLPIFIDKPLAYTISEAKKIMELEKFSNQIFTCSSLRYAREFNLDEDTLSHIGDIKFIEAISPKSWLKYGIHIIQPVLGILPDRGNLIDVKNSGVGELNLVTVKWERATALLKTIGNLKSGISIKIFGTKDSVELNFDDTFFAFKSSLRHFIDVVREKRKNISREETFEIISIIERGTNSA